MINTRSIIESIKKEISKLYPDPILSEQYAWWLLEEVTELSRTDLLVKSIELSDVQLKQLRSYVDELVNKKKPLAYILGRIPFLDLEIVVKPPLLIPRPETEEWVAYLISLLKPYHNTPLEILDLCTGTGCIGLAIAKAYPLMRITAVDINPFALEITRENARMNGVTNVETVQSDLFSNLAGKKFDLIVSNPPYISHQEYETLDESVKLWEDYKALVADNEGLALVERIIDQSPTYLKKNKELTITPHAESMGALNVGNLWIEIGHQQASSVQAYMKKRGYVDVRSYIDMAKKERVIIGTYEAQSIYHNSN